MLDFMYDFSKDLSSKEHPPSAHMLPRRGGKAFIFLQAVATEEDANRPGQFGCVSSRLSVPASSSGPHGAIKAAGWWGWRARDGICRKLESKSSQY